MSTIIKTTAYFDLLDRPVTLLELHKGVGESVTVTDLLNELTQLIATQKIATKFGYYFLPERGDLIAKRHTKYVCSINKLKRARWYARLLLLVPFVRGVLLYNSVAFFNARETSDIDLLIITKTNRVWSARFYINTILKLLRLRPTAKRKRNAACVSFLIDQIDLGLQTTFKVRRELFPMYHHGQFIVLGGEVGNFFAANMWLSEALLQWYPYRLLSHWQIKSFRLVQIVLEALVSLISESYLKRVQQRIMPKYYTADNEAGQIVLNDQMIKLHNNATRLAFEQRYHERLTQLGIV